MKKNSELINEEHILQLLELLPFSLHLQVKLLEVKNLVLDLLRLRKRIITTKNQTWWSEDDHNYQEQTI